MKTTATVALACTIGLMWLTVSARAESGYIAVDKASLAQAEKHGVAIQITSDGDDRFHLDIRITPVNQKADYTLELLLTGGSRIRMQQRVYDGKVFSEHWLSKELMSSGKILISGIAGHVLDETPDNNLLIDLKSFVKTK